MATVISRQISEVLWPPGQPSGRGVWAILDGARSEMIHPAVQSTTLQKGCLYAGRLAHELEVVAPYLVRLEEGDPFTDLVLERGWGNAWGVFFRSASALEELQRHLRGFLRVRDESGRRMIFRFYDPRVLRIYLPTCLPDELETFFGPIDRYMMEEADATMALEFGFDGRQLTQKRIHPAGPVDSAATGAG